MSMPLDRSRPLWHSYLVDGFGSGAAVINRMHHCIADGIALARVMLSLTDSAPDAGIAAPLVERRRTRGRLSALGGPTERALATTGRLGATVIRQSADVVVVPLARGRPRRRGRARQCHGAAPAADAGRRRQRDQRGPRHQPTCRLGRADPALAGQAHRARSRGHRQRRPHGRLEWCAAPLPAGARRPRTRDTGDGAVQPAPTRRARPARAGKQVRVGVPAAPRRGERKLSPAARGAQADGRDQGLARGHPCPTRS